MEILTRETGEGLWDPRIFSALQSVLGSAINNGLPAFPIPTFTLPASVATYGLPAGAQLGIVNPVLTTSGESCVLDGQFGER